MKFLYALISALLVQQALWSGTYDLESILDMAWNNNKQIKLAQAELKTASANKLEAISTALPKINVDVNYNRNFFDNFFYVNITDSAGRSQTTKFEVSFRNEYMLNASLDQTLFSFGRVGNAIRAANYYAKYTENQYKASWQSIIIHVKKSFYQALLTQQVYQVAQASESSASDNYENIRTKYETGVSSEFELLQAESRWQNAIPNTMQAKQNQDLALNNLKILVQIPLNESVTLVGDMEKYPPIPDSVKIDSVFSSRPEYLALIWEKQLQEKRVAIEKSNFYPSLNGNLTYAYGARSDRFVLENDNDNLIAGVTLSIPIFSGLYTNSQVQKARADVEKVQTRIDIAIDDIRIELKNLRLLLDQTFQRILATRKGVETANRSFEIAETRVQAGLATQLELKDSRVLLDEAQLNYYTAIYDYLNAYFDWQYATGNVAKTNSI